MQNRNNYVDLIEDLKDSTQEKAIKSLDNSVLLACPGAGKTNTLVLKIAYLLNEVIKKPRGLACITFSNNAAREFKNRLKRLNIPINSSVFFGTIHSFCLSEVIMPYGNKFDPRMINDNTEIASREKILNYLNQAIKKVGIAVEAKNLAYSLKKARYALHLAPKESKIEENKVMKVAEEYEILLRTNNLIDFEDIIILSLKIIENYPLVLDILCSKYPWLIVDEYQDLSEPLHRLVIKFLETKKVKIFAVGDPNQSILGFNGASPEHLKNLAKRQDVICFESNNNYRCCQEIIDASSIIIGASGLKSAKKDIVDRKSILYQECSQGREQQIELIIEKIIPFIKGRYDSPNIAILLRGWYDVNYFNEKLNKSKIQTIVTKQEEKEYDRTRLIEEIEELARWCSGGYLSGEPKFNEVFRFWSHYLSNIDYKFSQKSQLQKQKEIYSRCEKLKDEQSSLKDWIRRFESVFNLSQLLTNLEKKSFGMKREIRSLSDFYDVCIETEFGSQCIKNFAGLESFDGKIVLTTLHGSKGMQFDAVIMPMLEEGVIPSWRKDEDIEEAKRIFYVGLTRARDEVYLLWSGFTVDAHGRKYMNGKSRFVTNLLDAKKGTEIQLTLDLYIES